MRSLIFASVLILAFMPSKTPAQNLCTNDWREIDYRVAPFPDLAVRYFSYQFKIPKGQKLAIKFKGKFPTARYTSFHVYDQLSEDAVSTIYDAQIEPALGSINPYRPGSERYAKNRSYEVVAACADSSSFERSINLIKLPCNDNQDELVDIWYRIYLNEGDINLPEIEVFDPSVGTPLNCPQLAPKYDSIATVAQEDGSRSLAPFLFGRTPAPLKNGDVHFYWPDSRTLGANEQVRYMATRLDGNGFLKGMPGVIERKQLILNGVMHHIGNITVLKFKSPTFPDTEKNLTTFSGNEEVRYWSICVSGELTDASNCLHDSQVKTLANPQHNSEAVLVIGPDNEEIKAQVEAKGFNYLNHSQHRSPVVFYRQMLAREDFSGRIENVTRIKKSDFEVPGEDPRKTQVSPDSVSKFFGDTNISTYSPTGRQCFYKPDEFFETYCGFNEIKLLEKNN